jgi:hypothetical protein
MLRRITTFLAIAALVVPVLARANEWEEDYSGEGPPADDYPVSVDVDASASVSFDTFHGALAPYGDWVVAGSYGRVWRPHVAAGWRPYYYGRWEWTNEGWLWVSDEPWGWGPYHYGRWAVDAYYGWVWVPGYQWAPAWVSWRYSGDVVGWAPLAPGVSVYVSVTPYSDAWWTFVPCNGFVGSPVYRIAYAPSYTHRYFNATAPAPARPAIGPGRGVAAPVWGGPPPRVIEQRIGRPVTPVRVVTAPSPGPTRVRPGEVSIFRPEVRGNGGRSAPAPGAAPRPEVQRQAPSGGQPAFRYSPNPAPRPEVQRQAPSGGMPAFRNPPTPAQPEGHGGGAVAPRAEPRRDAAPRSQGGGDRSELFGRGERRP